MPPTAPLHDPSRADAVPRRSKGTPVRQRLGQALRANPSGAAGLRVGRVHPTLRNSRPHRGPRGWWSGQRGERTRRVQAPPRRHNGRPAAAEAAARWLGGRVIAIFPFGTAARSGSSPNVLAIARIASPGTAPRFQRRRKPISTPRR